MKPDKKFFKSLLPQLEKAKSSHKNLSKEYLKTYKKTNDEMFIKLSRLHSDLSSSNEVLIEEYKKRII